MAIGTGATETRIEPLLLKPGEVATLLGISRSRAYEMLARGDLPGVIRLGRSVRVSRKALVDWVDQAAGFAERGQGPVPPRS